MLELLLGLALGAGALSNFPQEAGGRIDRAAIGITLDGAPAVVAAAGDRVVAYRYDGGSPAGFPFQLPAGEEIVGGPAAGDLAGDGRVAVAVVTASGKVWLVGGGAHPGFPASLGAPARAGASFVDVDGDGRPELVVGDARGRIHALGRGGAEVAGFPIQAGSAAITTTVSGAVFAGGRSLAAGCADGRVPVVGVDGRPRPGFPLVTGFVVTGAPVFADLDDDGRMDLVVASQDFHLDVVDDRGAPLPGFPFVAGYRIYQGPAVVDLDGDGHLEVVFASADGMLHVLDAAGRERRGFPVRVGARLFGGPAVGDLDRSGALAIAVATEDGTVAAVTAAGQPLPGFPAPVAGGEVTASPLAYDLAGDGSLSLFVGSAGGTLSALRATRAGGAPARVAWEGEGRDAGRAGRLGPLPPSYKELVLSPAAPTVGDALAAAWRAVWLDAGPGQLPPPPSITWLRDGVAVPALAGLRTLPAGTARRGERWCFELAPPGGGAAVRSREARIADTAPTAPGVELAPAAPALGEAVRATIVRPSVDADGDPVRYAIDWLLDGVEAGVTGETFPGDRLRRGALLSARVIASDGELAAAPVLADARVANSPPGPAAVALSPERPGRADALHARVVTPARDPDGDPVTYHHRWAVDGVPADLPLGAATFPAGLARKHQRVSLELRAFDGAAEGPPASASVELVDSPPGPPRVELRPERPRRGQAIRAILAVAAEDADGDPLSYRWSWTKNGAPLAVAGEGREVPGAEVAKGDRFEVVARAFDGEEQGPAASAGVTVADTPPEPPRIAIEPRHPVGGETLRVAILEPARDADGDPVQLGYRWTRGGAPTGIGGDTLLPTAFHKHDRVRVVVTPTDGLEAGRPVSDEVEVADAPPGAPGIAFEPPRPTVTAPLAVGIVAPAVDPDGDAVTYRYRWLRNGSPVLLDGDAASRSSAWTTASSVPVHLLARGDAWEVEVQAFDGERDGPPARLRAVIGNSPPPPPRIAFDPPRPRGLDGIALAIAQAPDPDGDHVTYRYAWTRDGQRYEPPGDPSRIPRGVPRRGERWAVEVVASDGLADAPAVRAEVTVADAAPGAPEIALCDGPVPAGPIPDVRIVTPASDPDGDPVRYEYEWSVDGRAVPSATGPRLGQPLRKHDVARVVVTPTDGALPGPSVAATCTARDTPPTAPTVALDPAAPTALTGIAVDLVARSVDGDGDPVTYRYAWTRDGTPVALDGPLVPPRTLRHGEVWRVEVTPGDGEEDGPPVLLSVTVANTPPPPPSVVVTPLAPTAGLALTCEATVPERDVDGEPIRVRSRWLRDGQPQPVADGAQLLPAGTTRRGERWRCEAWSSDGEAESAPGAAEVRIQDSPPGAPQVVIDPPVARVGDALACRIEAPSVDPDGDRVTYAFAWWRNGRPLPPGADPARVAAAIPRRGDRFRCAATPGDGTLAGPAATAEATIANSAPGPARVRLSPPSPVAGAPLRCEVVVPSRDPDGDAVRYRYRWHRNGILQPFSDETGEVAARLITAGDRWRCAAVPTDGELDGPEAVSEEARAAEGPR